ncbi:MAG: hypothetical protein KDK65_05300, partial [Chlamydiia bacterium]|nr:hypothetical protein [Chlamydiia bacterium]
ENSIFFPLQALFSSDNHTWLPSSKIICSEKNIEFLSAECVLLWKKFAREIHLSLLQNLAKSTTLLPRGVQIFSLRALTFSGATI